MYTNKQIWNVSYPIFLSLLAQNVINVTDTAFLGRVGEVELGAAAMGGLFYICIYTIAFGFSTGSQIVMARRNGEKQYADVGPVMIQGIVFLFLLAGIVFTLSKLYAENVISLLISSEQVRGATMEFLDWRVFGFFFSFVNVMYRAFYVGITRTKVLTMNAVVMAVTNVILDYVLIFGHLGFPAMGIKGAAIASVVAEGGSILFFVIYTRLTVNRNKYGLNRLTSFDFALLGRVLNISIFTMMQYFFSMGSWFMFFVVVERIGVRDLAIANIVRSIYVVMVIPVSALSTTTNTFVSNTIGAGKTDQVMGVIAKISKLSFYIMAVFASVVCLFPKLILSVYTNDPLLIADSYASIYVISAAMLISSVGSIFFSGVTGTGNTRSALTMETITLVFYGVYIYLVGMVFKQPVEICFTTEIVYYTGLLAFSYLYLKKGRWQHKKI